MPGCVIIFGRLIMQASMSIGVSEDYIIITIVCPGNYEVAAKAAK